MRQEDQVLPVLTKVRENLQRGWTQNTMARTAKNRIVNSTDANAARWCLLGACYQATGNIKLRQTVLESIADVIGGDYFSDESLIEVLTKFNDADSRKKQEVIGVVDKAMRRLVPVKTDDKLVASVAQMLLTACESPSGRLRPWKPFDVTQLAKEIIQKVKASK